MKSINVERVLKMFESRFYDIKHRIYCSITSSAIIGHAVVVLTRCNDRSTINTVSWLCHFRKYRCKFDPEPAWLAMQYYADVYLDD
jgi:hypothetical protein